MEEVEEVVKEGKLGKEFMYMWDGDKEKKKGYYERMLEGWMVLKWGVGMVGRGKMIKKLGGRGDWREGWLWWWE